MLNFSCLPGQPSLKINWTKNYFKLCEWKYLNHYLSNPSIHFTFYLSHLCSLQLIRGLAVYNNEEQINTRHSELKHPQQDSNKHYKPLNQEHKINQKILNALLSIRIHRFFQVGHILRRRCFSKWLAAKKWKTLQLTTSILNCSQKLIGSFCRAQM